MAPMAVERKGTGLALASKELLPIVLVCMVRGSDWKGKRVWCHCDNLSVMEVLNNGYSRDATLMHLLT